MHKDFSPRWVSGGASGLPGPQVLTAFLEATTDAVLVTDAPSDPSACRIVHANRAFLRMTGYGLDEVLGRSPRMFQGAESDRATLSRLRRAMEAREPFEETILNYRKSGEKFWMSWRLVPICGDDGALVNWLAIQRDLTQDLAREQSVRQLNDQLELLLRASGDGIWDWDLVSDTLHWSPRLLEILGISEISFFASSKAFFSRLLPQDLERVWATLEAHLERREPFDVNCRMIAENGSILEIAAKGQAVWGEDGTPLRMIGTARDMTEERRRERDMLRAEEIAEFGHWEIDLRTGGLGWSPQVFRIQGFEPGSFVPDLDTAIACYHPEDREGIRRAVEMAVEEKSSFRFEGRVVRPDGEERYVFAEGEVEVAPDGSPVRLFGILSDRTALKQKERELARSQRMDAIGQLVGGVAHDFNNLLAVIMGNMELIQELKDQEPVEMFVAEAIAAARRGGQLTQSLMSFAQVAPLSPSSIRPEAYLETLRPLIERTMPANIGVFWDTGADVWPVTCDPAMLEACILNLVLNARDAMPEGGSLTLAIENLRLDEVTSVEIDPALEPGPFVVISVTDTGVGMSPDQLERATEPYFTTKAVGRGTGLGLSRVQGFAEQSGGYLKIYSEPGHGTSVKLILPADPVDLTAGSEQDSLQAPALGKVRALLVEDMPQVQKTIERLLMAMGLDVTVASTGDEALEICEAGGVFDVIVTDIVMPGRLQGPGLVRELRRRGYPVRPVFMSGYPREAMIHGNGLRPDDVRLMKPVSKADLAHAIADALKIEP